MKIITSPNAPAAVGPYSQAIEVGDFIFFSGQIPLDPQSGNLIAGGITEQTQQVFQNILAVLDAANLKTNHIVKTTVFMTNLADFSILNDLYAKFFGDHKPARSTVQVSQLPKQAVIEIECIAVQNYY